jgi:hypothetical protein
VPAHVVRRADKHQDPQLLHRQFFVPPITRASDPLYDGR